MALVTIQRSSPSVSNSPQDPAEIGTLSAEVDEPDAPVSINECYYAKKGAALVLSTTGRGSWRVPPPQPVAPASPPAEPLQAHQPDIQDHLQSMFYLLRPEETLKMAVKLESIHPDRTRYLVVVSHDNEALLLGIDCNSKTTIGLVLRVLADTSIKLDGDGGFSVCVCGKQHIFKPVSVQAMWSALQTLHRASDGARTLNHFAGGTSHSWAEHYEHRIASDRSCLNEWHTMDSIESRRPPSPNSLRHKPYEREETERVIRTTLKEIMMSVDLDEVTSKAIRGRLEEELDMDLAEYKSFIDEEILTILGQMDAPTEIFDHVYLGSEWNASNLEELQRNGIRHILNVTREIDNFFPGMFDYLNIRVYDDDRTDLLKHWDNTYKYITKAKNEGSKVLVHCKMGISRSASVVIAYAMKAYNWNFDKALSHVKKKRSCIKPNSNFLIQLETYQGILDAMKNKEKLQRSKSETNLKSPTNKLEHKRCESSAQTQLLASYSGRPRSWSPDAELASSLLPPTSVSLESLAPETRHTLARCANGTYSVSPNQILRLKGEGAASVKHIVSELESVAAAGEKKTPNRRHLRLNFESDPVETDKKNEKANRNRKKEHKTDTWDPGEKRAPHFQENIKNECVILKCDSSPVVSELKMQRLGNVIPQWCDPRQTESRQPDLGVIRERYELQDNRCRPCTERGPVSRLSTSAPGSGGASLADRPFRPHSSQGDLRLAERATRPHSTHGAGFVRNLKMEFEAKSQEVRVTTRRPILRRSFCGVLGERPPLVPRVPLQRRQHGRSHPLARLTARCSNPVYNTM